MYRTALCTTVLRCNVQTRIVTRMAQARFAVRFAGWCLVRHGYRHGKVLLRLRLAPETPMAARVKQLWRLPCTLACHCSPALCAGLSTRCMPATSSPPGPCCSPTRSVVFAADPVRRGSPPLSLDSSLLSCIVFGFLASDDVPLVLGFAQASPTASPCCAWASSISELRPCRCDA